MPSSTTESERQTRRERIDPKLETAGWKIVRQGAYDASNVFEGFDGCALEEYPTDNGPADYALVQDGRILGIVEAKRVSLGPQNVLTQAERYSMGATASPLNFHGFRVPFLYSTNGEIIWHRDVRPDHSRSRKIAAFHTPSALSERFARDPGAKLTDLAALPNDHPWIRDYQKAANDSTEKAIREHKRLLLLAMATGSGKTFTMVNQIYRLLKTSVAKRVLFLVDRRSLAAQAVRAFASYEGTPGLKFNQEFEVYSQRFRREDMEDDDEPFDPSVLPEKYLTDPQQHHTFVYVATIQRMAVNLFGRGAAFGHEDIDEDANNLDIPIHAFDVIVADECHRGYTSAELSVWRGVLDHFDAIKIGLTATPASHTTSFFREVVFRYSYEDAVRENYLVDYDLVKLRSDVRMKGVFLKEGEQVGNIDPETGQERFDLLEDERQFDSSEVERKVTSPDSNRKILTEIGRYAVEHEEKFGRFPKILIFADNDLQHTSHADQLVDTARDVFGQGDSFVQKITGRADRPLQRIREFRNRPNPKIVVTVDMLTTGVDIPDLEFIVLLRQVKSRILFEQMLGRGTRRGEKFPDKSHFTVFDCFDGTIFDYFAGATGITADPILTEPRTIPEIIQDIWDNRDRDYNTRCLVKRLQRIDKRMSGEARELFARFVPNGGLGAFARDLADFLRRDFGGAMAILRDPDFQQLLADYPRAPRSFTVAYGTEDTVSSALAIRDGAQTYKPEDYLAAFAEFVRENTDHLDALRILLNRPRDWSPEALKQLRETLRTGAPRRFTERNLQIAHEARYDKALADLISMVKHAVREEEVLTTAEERVARALGKLSFGKALTEPQTKWLDRIRAHLIENLSIDREDFDAVPVLADAGGWGRADRDFEGRLSDIVIRLNEAIAA